MLPKLSKRRPQIILLDATDIKVSGEGEWKVKIHGKTKRRKWIKVHIAVDEKTQEILQLEITDGHTTDCKVGPKLISAVETIFSRMKGLYGGMFYSRKMGTQKIEGHLKCLMMNQMV